MKATRIALSLLASTVLASLSAGRALAADPWKANGGDCDQTAFKSPLDASLKHISECVKLWEAYKSSVKDVKGLYKENVSLAMQLLYQKGSDDDAAIAKIALGRLGVTDLPARSAKAGSKAGTSGGTKAADDGTRKPYAPPTPSKADIKAADAAFKTGYGAYQKQKFDVALKSYLKMVDVAPGYHKGHYNVACAYALLGDEANMNKFLQNLRDMAAGGDVDANKVLRTAWSDTDFKDIKDKSLNFKRITGYTRVLLINDIPEQDEKNFKNLTTLFEKLGYKPDTKDSDKKPLKKPHIFYLAHADHAAYAARKLIKHDKTVVKLMDDPEALKGYDMVVQWSDDIKKGEEQENDWVSAPDKADKELAAIATKQDEILMKPDQAIDEVDAVLQKPGDVVDDATSKVDKTKKSVDNVLDAPDKVNDQVDRVKGLFK